MKHNTWQCEQNPWASTGQAVQEKTIIDLHHILLTTGIHYLQGDSMSQNRHLMELLLVSLNYYHSVAFISLDDSEMLKIQVEDLLDQATFQHCMNGTINFAEYLVQEFDYDFLWIESSPQLLASGWYKNFMQCIKMLGVEQHIPIVITR